MIVGPVKSVITKEPVSPKSLLYPNSTRLPISGVRYPPCWRKHLLVPAVNINYNLIELIYPVNHRKRNEIQFIIIMKFIFTAHTLM